MANTPLRARVLVIDDDSTCLTIVSAMLRKLHHEVVTVKNPLDGLSILRTEHEVLDLVLSDVHMPQMSGIELQKRVAEEFETPVVCKIFSSVEALSSSVDLDTHSHVVMSEDGKKDLVLRGLESGAAFFILKPIQLDDLKNLWQLAITKRNGKSIISVGMVGASKQVQIKHLLHDYADYSVPSKDIFNKYQMEYLKRKAYDEVADEETGSKVNYLIPKKRKVVWTVSLHNRFLEAVEKIGFHKAVPKKILAHMNVPGLTRDHVASHLQKYRIFLKRISAGTTSAHHEPSWKESPLGSNSSFYRPQLRDFGCLEDIQTSAHQHMKSRSIIGVPSDSVSQTGCSELPSFSKAGFPEPSASAADTVSRPACLNFGMKEYNIISNVDLNGGHSADKEISLVQSPIHNLSYYHQYAGLPITDQGQDVINDKQMGLVVGSSNGYNAYVLSNDLSNTNQDCLEQNLDNTTEQENMSLPHLDDLRNEKENHFRSENVDMLTFGDASLTQLLGDDEDATNDKFFGQLNVELSYQVKLL
ncbi:hypothetical protein Dimus_000306 [Dionaea muscipula]